MRNKLGILVVSMMIAAACGGGTSVEAVDPSGADATAADVVQSADIAESTDTDAHHLGETDVTEHGHDEEVAEHHEGDTEVAEHGHEEGVAEHVVEVSMTEFSFESPELAVTSGETVSFVVTNNGRTQHEFRVTTEHTAGEHLAQHQGEHADHMTSEEGHHQDFFVMIEPGATETLTVHFDHDAEFDMAGCLLPGHWEAGLHAPLVIAS